MVGTLLVATVCAIGVRSAGAHGALDDDDAWVVIGDGIC